MGDARCSDEFGEHAPVDILHSLRGLAPARHLLHPTWNGKGGTQRGLFPPWKLLRKEEAKRQRRRRRQQVPRIHLLLSMQPWPLQARGVVSVCYWFDPWIVHGAQK